LGRIHPYLTFVPQNEALLFLPCSGGGAAGRKIKDPPQLFSIGKIAHHTWKVRKSAQKMRNFLPATH
jgi:hypothetical protein